MRRIVLTGPECTGKTSLAAQLAAELRAPLLTESARSYADDVGRELTVDDVERIAKRAITREDELLATHPAVLVLDTDLISTTVYARHYYGFHSAWLEREAHARRGDLYLLCEPDIPWIADGIRDRPADRVEIFGAFCAALNEFGAPCARVAGLGDARIASARAALRAHSAVGV